MDFGYVVLTNLFDANSRKILLSKNDRDKRGERLSKFPVEFFLSHSAKFFVRELFSVSLIAGIKKVWTRGGREYRDFPSKFLSHCTDIFHWRTLWSFKKSLFWKIFTHRRRASWFFEMFCLRGPKRKAL